MASPSPLPPEENLAPYQLRDRMRKTVNAALAAMETDEYQMALDEMSIEDRRNAIIAHGRLYRLKVKLVNAMLDEIRDKLKENEAELRMATDDLTHATEKIEKVADILDAANRFLGIAAKVIAFV